MALTGHGDRHELHRLDDAERDRLLRNANGKTCSVTRFKGLGEMNPHTLKETTLDPKRRTLLRVAVSDRAATNETIQRLMGRDVEPRFKFIMDRAAQADLDL